MFPMSIRTFLRAFAPWQVPVCVAYVRMPYSSVRGKIPRRGNWRIIMTQDTWLHQRNFRHLALDTLWFGGLLGSSMAFLTVYAARLGASSLLIGLFTAGPAVVNLFFSLPAGRWLEGRSFPKQTFLSSLWHRLGYVCLIPLAWLLDAHGQTWAMALITLLMAIPGTLLAVSFNAMFAAVVPPEQRARLVGVRTAVMALAVILTTLLCGQILDAIPFPVNYQLVFVIGGIAAAMSSFHLGKIRQSPGAPPMRQVGRPIRDPARPGGLRFGDELRNTFGLRFLTRAGDKSLLRFDLLHTPFGPLLGAYLAFYFFQYIPIPLFPLFWVRELKLTDAQISIANALFYITLMVASLGVQRISAWLGNHRLFVLGAVLYGIYPLLTGLASDQWLLYLASLMGGAVWGLTNSGLLTRLMERIPEDDRPAHMAFHNLALNIGILTGSLVGPLMGDALGLRGTIILAAALRLLGGVLIGIWG
ncbi:MAG: MFS transporter [Chloroflexi bacterium]|nr:MFS transporter [Chloroflexota bacterium]